MSQEKLNVESLIKDYGRVRAVDGISFAIQPGAVFGLLGKNGAGKTSTITCILGLSRPTGGSVLVDGHTLSHRDLAEIAYVPEVPSLYGWMTGAEHAHMRSGYYPLFDMSRMKSLSDSFGVPLNKTVRSLSKGQQQSIALSLAFAQRPTLMILDEPASGLDPVAQREVLELIVRAGTDGTTILLCSHHINQVERAAETVAILDRGHVVLSGNIDQLRSTVKLVEAMFEGPPPMNDLKRQLPSSTLSENGSTVYVRVDGDTRRVQEALNQFAPLNVRVVDQSLEDIFLATVGGDQK